MPPRNAKGSSAPWSTRSTRKLAPDLAPLFHRALARVASRARSREAAGDREGAARDFRQAAELALKLARETAGGPAREARRLEASRFESAAARLETPAAQTEQPAAGTAGPASRNALPDVSALLATSRVAWSDVVGLDEAATGVRTALALLLARYPEAIRLAPPRGILLYGPPGNGKTLLAAAASRTLADAHGGKPCFFDVRLPFVLSKYFGESSRIVSEVYRAARERAPAIVFVDELDALTRDRDADESGPERRILATFLSELDGLAAKGSRSSILTIAATNRPWDIDAAVLSRFDRRILVGLPGPAARRGILKLHLPHADLASDEVLDALAGRTDGYGGRDLESLVRGTVEAMISAANPDLPRLLEEEPEALRRRDLRIERLGAEHFERALARLGPRDAREIMSRYETWTQTTGA